MKMLVQAEKFADVFPDAQACVSITGDILAVTRDGETAEHLRKTLKWHDLLVVPVSIAFASDVPEEG